MFGERTHDWIRTYTGKKFYLFDSGPDDVDIEDIAHALSMQCRYNGHVQRFYSVAEHSAYVSAIVAAEMGNAKYDINVALWALLHDASEAYLGDVSRPLKHQPEMARYRENEKRVMGIIAAKFGLQGPEPEMVTRADRDILRMEVRALKWGEPIATVEDMGEVIPVLRNIQFGIEPEKAKAKFLRLYDFMTGLREMAKQRYSVLPDIAPSTSVKGLVN